MQEQTERRRNPRLRLSYPIELSVRETGKAGGTRAVTSNLSARGAYFTTFSWKDFREGEKVLVKIQVPHPLHTGEESIHLHMSAEGRLRRVEAVRGPEAFGEDGVALGGVAVEFDAPLEFRYLWM